MSNERDDRGAGSRVSTCQLLRIRSIALLVALGLSGVTQAANSKYTLIDLGTLGGTTSSASGLNASGQVVGSSTLAGDKLTHGFVYSNGTMKDIGTLPGGNFSVATAINASGQIAGSASTAAGKMEAFRYTNGSMVDITVTDPSVYIQGWGINDSGDVVGSDGYIFSYIGSTLNILGGPGFGLGINASGQITGQVYTFEPGTTGQPFVYTNGSYNILPTLGGLNGAGAAINAIGNVAGAATTFVSPAADGPGRAFFYDSAGIHDLGTLGGTTSNGNALNDGNEVVGAANIAGDAAGHAFLYSGGTMVDLNTLVTSSPLAKYVTLTSANGINNNGWIVANGVDSRTGKQHAYLLEPPSLDGTVSPPAAEIIDGSGNVWTVSKGVVYENGKATPSGAVIELLLSKGVIYQENVHKAWWLWSSQGTWVATASPLSPSVEGTSIPTASNIVDNSLNIWALSAGGQVYENGTLTPSGGVIFLVFDGNVVYQENLHHNWWMWVNGTWVVSADPRVPSANETSIPPATQLTDGSRNTWIVSKGQVYEDGQLTPSAGVIRLLLLNNVVYQENLHDNWWQWVNGKWLACAAPLTASANGTTIPAATQIIDSALNIWTVQSGVVYKNHAPTASGDVTLLLYYGGVVYQQNGHGLWWLWRGSTWVPTSNPR